MHRQKLLKLLLSYSPQDELEHLYKERTLTFIEKNPCCFERSLEEGHITGSAWLLNKDCSKALLLLHSKLNRWVQPGGHCDGHPDVLETSLREAQEESGISSIIPLSEEIFDLDIHLCPAFLKGEQAHVHYDIRFLLKVVSDEQGTLNRESKKLLWVGREGALPTESLSVVRMFEKWKKVGVA